MTHTNTTNYLVPSYPNRGITLVKGEGVYLFDDSGKKYLDLGSNYGVNILGYQHPQIIQALHEQLDTLTTLHGSFGSDVRMQAAKALVHRCGGGLTRVYFSNSGAEAIEAALKFARLATGKSHIVAMKNAYHGKTLGALSVTGSTKYRDPFLPLLWEVTHVEFGNIDILRDVVRSDTAAIIIEPVQGEAGIIIPSRSFCQALSTLCREKNILLIVDEIQTGLGRTGTFLAGEQFGLSPDILCLGKGLAGGIPVGATLVSERVAQKIPTNAHTSTFGGNPLAVRGIIATLEALDDDLFEHIRDVSTYFVSQLRKIKHPTIKEIRGIGLMIGIELTGSSTPVLKTLQQEGIIAIPAGSTVVRFLLPYIIEKKEVDRTLKVLKIIFV